MWGEGSFFGMGVRGDFNLQGVALFELRYLDRLSYNVSDERN